jgi:hypothetical protein
MVALPIFSIKAWPKVYRKILIFPCPTQSSSTVSTSIDSPIPPDCCRLTKRSDIGASAKASDCWRRFRNSFRFNSKRRTVSDRAGLYSIMIKKDSVSRNHIWRHSQRKPFTPFMLSSPPRRLRTDRIRTVIDVDLDETFGPFTRKSR